MCGRFRLEAAKLMMRTSASMCASLRSCILSFQTCCIYDRVCYDLTGDPAVPRNAANAVIPVAAAVAVFVAPLSLYAVNPQASKGVVFFAGLITVGLEAAAGPRRRPRWGGA